MRLWHKDLIPVLPRQQLLGQWRECCAIMANIQTKGTPNHILVNKVMEYEPEEFMTYVDLVSNEMTKRGYNCNKSKFDKYREDLTLCSDWILHSWVIFEGWHNDRYLTQCYYNLQEKYDCGGITEDEWERIDARYEALIGATDKKECAFDFKQVKEGYYQFYGSLNSREEWVELKLRKLNDRDYKVEFFDENDEDVLIVYHNDSPSINEMIELINSHFNFDSVRYSHMDI